MKTQSISTFKLVWGTTWRGAAFGLLVGTFGGSWFGALFGNVLVFGVGLLKQPPQDLGLKDVPAAIGAMLFLALIGAVMGTMFGMPTGVIVGLMDGVLVGIITRLFFYPLKNARVYRVVIAVISFIVTTPVSWVGFMLIWLLFSNDGKADLMGLGAISGLPALVAGISAALISQIGARWYEKQSAT